MLHSWKELSLVTPRTKPRTRLLSIRLQPDWLDAIRDRCGTWGIDPYPARGRVGGVGEWVRQLIARELEVEPLPDPHEQARALLTGQPNPHHNSRRTDPPGAPVVAETTPMVMKCRLWLRVENNNKYVRGKSRSLKLIEEYLGYYYGAKRDGDDYILSIAYNTEDELQDIVDEIYQEIEAIADVRNGFTEAEICSYDDPNRSW